jgi:hypothetical protein
MLDRGNVFDLCALRAEILALFWKRGRGKIAAPNSKGAYNVRSKLSLVVCILLFILFATGLVQSAAAAPSDDACLLLTEDQLKSTLGVPVAAGTHTTPTYLKTCTWKPSSGPTDTLKFLTLNLEKGSVAFKLAMYGTTPPEKAMAIEKALALQVLSKL